MSNLHFFFNVYAETLLEQLEKERSHSYVVAITGTWGSGKTTLMNTILDSLNDRAFIKVSFNAWRYTKEEAVWRAFFTAILTELRIHIGRNDILTRNRWTSQDVQVCKKLIDETEKSLYSSFSMDVPGEITIDTGKLAKSGAKLALKFVPWGEFGSKMIDNIFIPKDDKGKPKGQSLDSEDIDELWGVLKRSVIQRQIEKITSMEQFRHSMETLLNAILKGGYTSPEEYVLKAIPKDRQYKLVVAIDDLDRCLPEQALEIFEAIKLFIDLPSSNFLLAMDQNMIQHALDLRYKQSIISRPQILAKQYTEKMIDLTFAIPSPHKSSFLKFVESDLPNGTLLIKMYDTLSKALPNNIRAWQRFAGKANLNQRIINSISEVNQLNENVLPLFYKLQCLSYRWPEIYHNLGSMKVYQELERCVREAINTGIESDVSSEELADAIKRSSRNSELVPEKIWQLLTERSLAYFINSIPNLLPEIDIESLDIWFSLDSTRP